MAQNTVALESWRNDLLRACERAAGPHGAALRRCREAVGLSQSELGSLAGLTQPAIAHAESGARHLTDPQDAAVRDALTRVLGEKLYAAVDARGRSYLRAFFDVYDVPNVLVAALVSGGRARAEAFAWSYALRVSDRRRVFGQFSRRLIPGVEVGVVLEARMRGVTVEDLVRRVAVDDLAAAGERRLLTEVGHALAEFGVGEEPAVTPALVAA